MGVGAAVPVVQDPVTVTIGDGLAAEHEAEADVQTIVRETDVSGYWAGTGDFSGFPPVRKEHDLASEQDHGREPHPKSQPGNPGGGGSTNPGSNATVPAGVVGPTDAELGVRRVPGSKQ